MMNGLLSLHKETLLQEVDPAGSTLFMPVHLTNSIYAIASYIRAYSDTSIRAIDYKPIFIKANRDKGKILSICCIYYRLVYCYAQREDINITDKKQLFRF